MWITAYGQKMWWCFTTPEIILLEDGSKVKQVLDRWHDEDINGKKLNLNQLAGSLRATFAFRGTICPVNKDFAYVVGKVNGRLPPEAEMAEKARQALIDSLVPLLDHLTWQDFEDLIDLIFRESGFKRIGPVGRMQKTLDLDLFHPLTNEKVAVQVKSRASIDDFRKYRDRYNTELGDYSRFFFVVHQPAKRLMETKGDENVVLLGPVQIAGLAVDNGLSEWLIDKTG